MTRSFATLMLGLSFSAAALAQEGDQSRYYVALDGGRTLYRDFCNGAGAGSCSNSGNAVRLAGGYNFTPMFALELGYADLGKAKFDGMVGASVASVEYRAEAVQFGAVGTFPLNEAFAGLLRLGVAHTSTTIAAPLVGRMWNADKNVVTAGIGGQFNFSRHTGLRFEFEHLGTFGDANTTGTSTVQLVSAGFIFHF